MSKLLDSLSLPADLRGLDLEQLQTLSLELRDELIESVSSSGGHFASSLGATELTVALHHVFDTPKDKLIWDVGHQGYIHKMLTGRRGQLGTIRQKDGLSGFLRRDESEYDAFGAGHAGTSISAAVGMAEAFKQSGSDRSVVAIIGDGSLTSGMAFEALNHAGELELNNLIVVLNDNEMSISKNVGALSWLFSKATTSRTSTAARHHFKELHKRGYVPEVVYKAIDRAEEATQGFFASPAMLFGGFGFRYIGPIDGHNVEDTVRALENAKNQDIPVLIHACTRKGKGYEPAEVDPLKWHGVKPFNRTAGEFLSSAKPSKPAPSYTKVFSDTLIDIANSDKSVVGITAAMPSGTGLDAFSEKHPKKFYDVGISEQHAVTFAAGLACEGLKPFCTIYSTFLQRGFDQIIHDVCIQNLPVRFMLDRGGVVGADGETHQGMFDIGYLRLIPNMVLMSPKDENELQHMVKTAGDYESGPIALRYPRGNGIGCEMEREAKALPIGKAEIIREGKDALLIGFGPIVQYALAAAEKAEQELGISTMVVNARFVKPLDTELFSKLIPEFPVVCTIEDHALQTGFGSALLEWANEAGVELDTKLKRFGLPDQFIMHGTQREQHELHGYTENDLFEYLKGQFQTSKVAAF